MAFRFRGLSADPFAPLFGLSDGELAVRGVRRMVADEKPGFPCRISLEDAEPGETVLLLNHEHQPAPSLFRACGPIFVRETVRRAFDGTDVPPVLRARMLSLRAYDETGLMVDADLTDGAEVETLLERLFARADTASVHVHYARRGCFACAVTRE